MNKHQNIFYINIISGYLEKFVAGKMPKVAYYSKEIMFMRNIKLFNMEKAHLAEDYMEIASRYKLPVVFVGILWTSNEEKFKSYDESAIENLTDLEKKVKINIHGEDIYIKVWSMKKDNIDIYLLDTNIDDNQVEQRNLTIDQFMFDSNTRIMRDSIISVGGEVALRELDVEVEIHHYNGEYSILGVYHRLMNLYIENRKIDLKNELEKIRNKTVTTIHDIHIKNYTLEESKGILTMYGEPEDFYKNIFQSNNIFTNIVLNSRMSNSVSAIHGDVIKKKIENDKVKNKIIDIVDGIYIQNHMGIDMLKSFKFQKHLLKTHINEKNRLIKYIYEKTFIKLEEEKLIMGVIATSNEYERWNLILRDRERLYDLLEMDNIQIIFYVQPSKSSSAEINFKKYLSIKRKYPDKIIFLNDLDLKLQKRMIRGCDLLLNTSKIPQEACGSVRAKAAINGVLNFSTLNGCWPEICVEGINGWQIGSGVRIKDTREQDNHDIESMYDVLVNKILPIYYEDTEKWEDVILQSIKSTMEYFCMERIVIEYYDNLYKQI